MSTYSLDGQWRFRCPHELRGNAPSTAGLKRWMPATMPGTIHHALHTLGKIEDPHYARNELDLQWIDQQDWELCTTVEVTKEDCKRARQELIFDGLDTVATIYLNGKKVGHSVNMFRQVVCDVRRVLHAGKNEVRVYFESPTAYTARESTRHHSKKSKRPEFVWQTGERRRHDREWIRKVQCHFGWDWGLFLATSGVWQPARLVCSNAPRISAVKTRQLHQITRGGSPEKPRAVELDITTYLESPSRQSGRLSIRCGGEMIDIRASLVPGENQVKVKLTLESPELWWPAGEGEQRLYDLLIEYEAEDGAVSSTRRRIGLRTIELVTKNDSRSSKEPAQSFFFRVNGRSIYARGADWIPVDQLVDRATPDVYRHLLRSMVEANMNMVRVWGGGWYEQDVFYDLCDELGILIWQDFMMACSLYPDTKEFIDELVAEAKYQVRRLHDRASLALWCGDNEDAEGVWSWWKNQPDFPKTVARYKKTLSALKKACEAEDDTRRFWLSSPSNDEFGPNPTDPNRGDIHYWKVWHGRQPFSNYLTVKPRFVSEFGFQSFPEPRTVRAVVPKKELNPSSRVMEHHQRSPEGNMLITNTMAREMPIPKSFDSFCWVSQINQAMAIRTAVEHWRREKPRCMGALYWQLNDLWPVASWSSIDYHGRWKVLQHESARFFAPLLASIAHHDGKVHVWVTSDLPRGLTLSGELDVLTWSGRRIARVKLRTRVRAQESREIATVAVDSLLHGKAEPHEVCCFVRLAGSRLRAENYATLVPWKWITLAKPRVASTLRMRRDGLELTVRSETVTPFFHAELDDTESHFRGDWQVLKPGTHVMKWVPHVDRGASELKLRNAQRRLRTSSLYDFYEH
jgi:beta-mannosidase